MSLHIRWSYCLLFAALLSACAGYRGGWQSVAYIGTPPSESSPVPRPGQLPLELPGLQMALSLDNRSRTRDTQVYLFVLPLSIDPRTVSVANNQPGKTRVYVTVKPLEPGFVFRPRQAVLSVADQRFVGSAGFEFGMWGPNGERVASGGRWDHRPLDAEFALTEAGRTYYLSIDFDTPTPSPQSREIAVDLQRALVSPRTPPLPLIRFAPVRWEEGYT